MARQGDDKNGKARQGIKARTQRTQGIGMPSSACHRQLPSASASSARHRHHRHRHAIIGMPSACHRHRHAIIGIIIGIGKACHHRHRQVKASARHRHAIGMPSSASAGRRTAERSKVAQYSHTDFERVLRFAFVKIFD
jgi:hypothetical protein